MYSKYNSLENHATLFHDLEQLTVKFNAELWQTQRRQRKGRLLFDPPGPAMPHRRFAREFLGGSSTRH